MDRSAGRHIKRKSLQTEFPQSLRIQHHQCRRRYLPVWTATCFYEHEYKYSSLLRPFLTFTVNTRIQTKESWEAQRLFINLCSFWYNTCCDNFRALELVSAWRINSSGSVCNVTIPLYTSSLFGITPVADVTYHHHLHFLFAYFLSFVVCLVVCKLASSVIVRQGNNTFKEQERAWFSAVGYLHLETVAETKQQSFSPSIFFSSNDQVLPCNVTVSSMEIMSWILI
jgi:hypothetical protein